MQFLNISGGGESIALILFPFSAYIVSIALAEMSVL